ncbi:leucine-rich repeat and fibronectin type-III domain-containing protein 3 [Photinus pyralis]|nr:leucine-rich repeat and fibronectin type-III domain-containing protein 3 [Photinus pyralis]
MRRLVCLDLLVAGALLTIVTAQCPWQRESLELQSSCLCSYNLARELSVQCDMVEWQTLLVALNQYATETPLDLLYVNNSTVGALTDSIFAKLKVHNIQLSGCKIKTVSKDAFKGQEHHLKNLNLQDNDLSEVPLESLRITKSLMLLDLSHNRISEIPDGAFETLTKLTTLKLSDNNITISHGALRGLDGSLKNLNLKGTRQKEIPIAVRGLRTLAFLDLSQNSIRELPGPDGASTFDELNSLTALNLERNLIQSLENDTFAGIRTTLSSLSLLNNLLPDFPTGAIKTLKELRVLDIGFNLLTELPENAFLGNPSLTLLALDGNPLSTIPHAALAHLNTSLRGLSLGGRFLHCDCRLSWVVEWIRKGDLQVTSRERNPQFCGSPVKFRDRGFYTIQPEELACNASDPIGVATVVNADLDDAASNASDPPKSQTSTTTTTTTAKSTTTSTSAPESSTSTSTRSSTAVSSTTSKVTLKTSRTTSSWRQNGNSRPPIIMSYPAKNKADDSSEVIVKNAYRQDNSVIIQWDSDTANILGFRVVYRLFGDKAFKQGPPLEASEREFKIKNVPSQECIVVCVVSLEEITVTPDTVPYAQCREVRTVTTNSSNMDKITIAASAAICGTIVVAVIIFVAASRRRSRKMHELHQQKLDVKHGLPIAGLPVNCCAGLGPAPSPGGPLSSLATLNAYNNTKDWDQISTYSTHSTRRPVIYPIEQPSSLQDDMRSHFSSKGNKARSLADGQSQHSFSNHSGRYLTSSAFPTNLLTGRQDLRHSRQSLALQSDRMSRASHPLSHAPTHSVSSSTRRNRPRSRSRDHHRPSSRYSVADSTHTLNNYCDNSDNWTDHDMDIYMARNPTTRGGLVPL